MDAGEDQEDGDRGQEGGAVVGGVERGVVGEVGEVVEETDPGGPEEGDGDGVGTDPGLGEVDFRWGWGGGGGGRSGHGEGVGGGSMGACKRGREEYV